MSNFFNTNAASQPSSLIVSIIKRLEKKFPDISIKIDEPRDKLSGHWFVDLIKDKKHFVLEYKPKFGFGLSNIENSGFGEGPAEVFKDDKLVYYRICEILMAENDKD